MIKRLLVANRGEIAVRVIRACREMGIEAVAVYSTADRDALHVKMADQAVCIGPPSSRDSYLNKSNLITAAVLTHCEAIHPGVGFLSENAGFARDIRDEGLIFIGATPEVIELLGDKVQAKQTAVKYNIPVIPGSAGSVANPAEAVKAANEIGYPVIIKAASGGGGKGMRIVRSEKEVAENIAIASREAESNFADGTVYLEKYLDNPRHVELQILADGKGKVVVLGERDCSVQKNHQKLLEESPSPGVTPEMRKQMSEDAQRLFSGLKYAGAGTIEFLVAGGKYYFMEVNARVQVEHPVTEMVTGVDIIKHQILSCTGGGLSLNQEDIRMEGYALECRVNAMTPGRVTDFYAPAGPEVRTDSFLYNGCMVPPHYDSMVAKVIVHAATRKEGLKRMERALGELVITGITTNVESQLALMRSKQFQSGNFGTSMYLEVTKESAHG